LIKLLLARHGETEWNRIGRYQGQSDIDLSSAGHEQARRLAKRLESEAIRAIHCSDLKRARQTVEPIAAGRKIDVTYCEELRELAFGDFEGKYYEEIQELYVPLEKQWRAGKLDDPVPGGESLAQLGERVKRFVDRLNSHNGDGTVLVVGHGGPLQMMILHLIGIDVQHWWRIHLDAASLSIVYMYPEYNLLSLMNGTSHLRD